MLQCSRCKEIKSEDSFTVNKARKRWYDYICKSCRNIAAKNRYANMTEEEKEKRKAYDKERHSSLEYKAQMQVWRNHNKDKIRESNKRFRLKHRDDPIYKEKNKKRRNKEVVKRSKEKYKFDPRYRLYEVRNNMVKRCNNKNHPRYWDYWWRWIKILRNNFDEFYYDMVEWYIQHTNEHWFGSKNVQIDRIDNNWHYCKENCRWVTAKQNNPSNHAKEFSS